MNLQAPSTISTPLYRLFPSPNSNYSLKFCRRTTSSELHSPAAGDSSPSVRTHRVTVHDRQRGLVHQFFVPEYILHTAESQNISLPFACRHGCCTSCAVRIKSGQIRQPEALGISAELKSKGYALLCVGFPSSDIEVETQDEDEAIVSLIHNQTTKFEGIKKLLFCSIIKMQLGRGFMAYIVCQLHTSRRLLKIRDELS